MRYLLGLDLGTSSVRAAVVDPEGRLVGVAGEEYPIVAPQLGWAEQDPEAWVNAAYRTVRSVLNQVGISGSEVLAVGLSGQMHGLVLVDENGMCLRPAIIWPDKRTEAQRRQLAQKLNQNELYQITGLPLATGFLGLSLLWVKEHEPETYSRIRKVLLPKDYIRYRLTGQLATDPTDASGTLLFDVAARKWSEDLLGGLELAPELLPSVLESLQIGGELTPEAAEATGLLAGTPVAVGGGDQAMAALGLGLKPGEVASTIATGGQLVTITPETIIDPGRRMHTLSYITPERSILMGAVLAAGLSLRWFRDTLGQLEKEAARNLGVSAYELLSLEAARAAPGSDGLFFLPYLSGERTPHMDPRARGCFIGLTLSHTKAHMARAVMEGVSFALKDSLLIMQELGVGIERIILSGGGARSRVWQQIQADIYGFPVQVVQRDEHSSYGAALAAGVAAGEYRDLSDALSRARSDELLQAEYVYPIEGNVKLYQEQYEYYKALYPALKTVFGGESGE